MPRGVLDLEAAVQTYAWGKKGHDSKVAQLAAKYISIKDEERYAELWMGTHPKGPATIKGTGQTLSDWLKENKWALSEKVADAYGDVPFIFKVLSIAQALSIQAHPHKDLAAQLRASNPKEYPDDNHKPEMCVTLTDFEGLMGFRPLTEIAEAFKTHPELSAAVGQKPVDRFLAAIGANPTDAVDASKAKNPKDLKDALKEAFSGLMHASDDTIEKQLNTLVERLSGADPSSLTDVDRLCLHVERDYPNDVGCFCVYFLNYVKLAPGDSMFMAANEPHAYLSGDTLECMSRSDNVVRSGLTPKFKDVETLVSMLTYDYGPGANKVLQGTAAGDNILRVYEPPIEEFTIAVADIPGAQAYTFKGVSGPSIFLCYGGDGSVEGEDGFAVDNGSVIFVAADTELKLKSGANGLKLTRAYCAL